MPPSPPSLPVSLSQVTNGPATLCQCRCGTCCRDMAIRATAADVEREPRLALVGHPIARDADGRPAAWMLNRLDARDRDGIGPCQFFLEESDRTGTCTIHATRPDVCRRLDCDALRDIAQNHLAEWAAALAAAEARQGNPESP